MPKFEPFLGMFLRIGSTYFEFVPHPLFPDEKDAVYVVEGGEALVYKICDVDTKQLYALKVMKPVYRSEHIARAIERLTHHPDLLGFYLQGRMCLTMTHHSDLIKTFPELEYAILMPWVEGPTWAGFMLNQDASMHYTFDQARHLALAVANVLWNLEARGLAHADIAGGNVLLVPDRKRVQLLDVEGMYIFGMPIPKKVSHGSPGYQHRHLSQRGQWCQEGDRFAGAIMLTEMLTWWNPRVRAHVADHAETLFRPEELQVVGTPCWQAVRNVLWSINHDLLALFDQAWASSDLAECPDLATWAIALL